MTSSAAFIPLTSEDVLVSGSLQEVSVIVPVGNDNVEQRMVVGRQANGRAFALGPDCTWCTSALQHGIVLGSNVICCTCFSSYDIATGTATGVTLQPVRSYAVQQRTGGKIGIIPEVPLLQDDQISGHDSSAVLPSVCGAEEPEPLEHTADQIVVIAGGGAAGMAAALELRDRGFKGRVIMVCGEDSPPYDRTALSKRRVADVNEIALQPASFFEAMGIELHTGVQLEDVDPIGRLVGLSDGSAITYSKLLLATGSVPKSISGAGGDSVFQLATMNDASAIQAHLDMAESPRHVVVVGAGLLGVEVTAMFCRDRSRVSHVTLVGAQLPAEDSLGSNVGEMIQQWLHFEGNVNVRCPALVRAIEPNATTSGAVSVILDDGESVEGDMVILCVGDEPNTAFLATSDAVSLAPDGAIVVDEAMCAGENIYAAGTAATGGSCHWASAVSQGRVAALSMLDLGPSALQTTSFSLQLLGLPVQCIGATPCPDSLTLLDGDFMPDIEHGERPQGALFVLNESQDAVAGVICVDMPDVAAAALTLLAVNAMPPVDELVGCDLLTLASETCAQLAAANVSAEEAEAERQEEEMAALMAAIGDADRSGCGLVPCGDLQRVLESAGLDLDEEEVAEAQAFLCKAPGASIVVDDLVKWWTG